MVLSIIGDLFGITVSHEIHILIKLNDLVQHDILIKDKIINLTSAEN